MCLIIINYDDRLSADNSNNLMKSRTINRICASDKSFLLLVVCTFLINFVGERIGLV
jgi:hypothetical protein